MAASRARTAFVCRECGAVSSKWQGQCSACNAWNCLEESVVNAATPASAAATPRHVALNQGAPQVQKLCDIKTRLAPRLATGLPEFDRALGGGLVEGGVTLIGGDPGIGKSTLLLEALAHLSADQSVLYVSGEESGEQIALRAQRLRLEQAAMNLPLLAEINLERILAELNKSRPRVVVIDSIQTLWTDALNSAPGSVAQVRECAAQLTRFAKTCQTSVILVGHVTKEGALAGPRVLEHMVDTVLYFEGDAQLRFRLLRACKNRFGAVNELGVFAMTEQGLKGVGNPSAIFLSQHESEVPGTSILVTQEGSRPLLVEIQALVDQAHGNPRRLTVGPDAQRLVMLLAVLHRHAQVSCADQDVFVNAVGGVRISEPAADLAVLLSIVSSLRNHALPPRLAVFGEVGLAGEVRPAPRGQERIKEAVKLGFTHLIIPAANAPRQIPDDVVLYPVRRVDEAIELMRGFS